MAYQGYEEYDFWHVFGGMPDEIEPADVQEYLGGRPALYKVIFISVYFLIYRVVCRGIFKMTT